MLLASKYIFICSFICIVTAKPLQELGGQTLDQVPSSNFSNLLFPINQSFTAPAPATNALRVECDGNEYGFNPDFADCQDALNYFQPSSKQFAFGNRHTGWGTDTIPLPYRMMGGTLFYSLSIGQRPSLHNFLSINRADKNKRQGALFLPDNIDTRQSHCPCKPRSNQVRRLVCDVAVRVEQPFPRRNCKQCGYVSMIRKLTQQEPSYPSQAIPTPKFEICALTLKVGSEGNLAVVLGTYAPGLLQCRGAFPSWTSCRDVLGDMPADTTLEVFGPQHEPGVQVPLPYAVESGKYHSTHPPRQNSFFFLFFFRQYTGLLTKHDVRNNHRRLQVPDTDIHHGTFGHGVVVQDLGGGAGCVFDVREV